MSVTNEIVAENNSEQNMSAIDEIVMKVKQSFYNRRGPPCHDRELCSHCVHNLLGEILSLMATDEKFFNKVKDVVRPTE